MYNNPVLFRLSVQRALMQVKSQIRNVRQETTVIAKVNVKQFKNSDTVTVSLEWYNNVIASLYFNLPVKIYIKCI